MLRYKHPLPLTKFVGTTVGHMYTYIYIPEMGVLATPTTYPLIRTRNDLSTASMLYHSHQKWLLGSTCGKKRQERGKDVATAFKNVCFNHH